MQAKITALLLAVCTLEGTPAEANNFYVPSSANNTLFYGDSSTNIITGVVTDLTPATFNKPWDVAITPTGNKAYVLNYDGNTVSIINTFTQAVPPRAGGLVANGNFNRPYAVAITPDGATAYVLNPGNDTVSVIDVRYNTVVSANNGIVANGNFSIPLTLAITPDGSTLYVANYNDDSISIVSTTTNSVTGTVEDEHSTLNHPVAMAITPDGSTAYVVNGTGNSVSVIDIATNRVTGTVTDTDPTTFDAPLSVAFTPDGTKAYVANSGNSTISVVNVIANDDHDANTVIGIVTDTDPASIRNPNAVTITPDGTYAYVADYGRISAIAVIRISDNTVIGLAENGTDTRLSNATVAVFAPASQITGRPTPFATRIMQKYGA